MDELLADESKRELFKIMAALRISLLNQTAKFLSQPFNLLFTRFGR